MKSMRILVAILLLLTGLLHVTQLLLAKLNSGTIITVAFGVIYLVLALLLFRPGKTVLWFGALVPLVGLLLASVGMLTNPTLLGVFFIAFDLIIVTFCTILLFRKG